MPTRSPFVSRRGWTVVRAQRKMRGKERRVFGGNRMIKLTEAHTAGPITPATRDLTLGQLLEQAAKRAPDRLALIAGVPDPAARRRWTYEQLLDQSLRTARALQKRFKPGER